MFRLRVPLSFVLVAFLSSGALAQVVQLPSYSTFSYSGGALVPDSGSAYLGGNRYGRSSSASRGWGPYASRASGSSIGGGAMSMSVQIIDLAAMDEALRMGAPAAASAPLSAAGDADRSIVAGKPTTEIEPFSWQKTLSGNGQHSSSQLVEDDIRFYLEKGRAAERAGRVNSARTYFRMATEAMTPELVARYQAARQRMANQASGTAEEPTDNSKRSF